MENLYEAIAEHFGCKPEDISGMVLGVEFPVDGQLKFRSIWAGVPWHMKGFLDQLEKDIAERGEQK